MAFTIDFFNEKQQSFSQSVRQNIGKRIIIVGSNETFDSSGYVVSENSSKNNNKLDFVSIKLSSIDAVKSAYGENNDLYNAYISAAYGGQSEVSILKVPYSRVVASDSVLTDRQQFKLNLISALNTLFEQDDFDVCVITSISLKEDVDVLRHIGASMANKNIVRLILANATSNSDSTVWDASMTEKLEQLTAIRNDMLKNICIVCNNAQHDTSKGPAKIKASDYNKIDKAAYIAALMVSSDKHPSLAQTIFNSVNEKQVGQRVTYFRENKIRGVVLSNFKTLGNAHDSKNTLSSAINVYRASTITSEIREALRPLLGTPIKTDSKYGTYMSANDIVSTILNKYLSLNIILDYDFTVSINSLKMLMDISIELIMCYELEAIKIHNTVGV